MMILYVILLLLVVFWKVTLFLLLAWPLRLFNLRCKSAAEEKQPDEKQRRKESIAHKNGIVQRIKNQLFFVITGYDRFLMYQIGYFPSHTVRNFVYRHIYLADISKEAIVYYGAYIRGGDKLHIGAGSVVGDKCQLDARRGGIFIGENVNIGTCVSLWTGSHDVNDPYFRSMPSKRGPIRIGNRAWLGSHCVVLDQVTIGEGAVVAAGAVVTKDVEPYSILAGVPAKKIGERNRHLLYRLGGRVHSHFY